MPATSNQKSPEMPVNEPVGYSIRRSTNQLDPAVLVTMDSIDEISELLNQARLDEFAENQNSSPSLPKENPVEAEPSPVSAASDSEPESLADQAKDDGLVAAAKASIVTPPVSSQPSKLKLPASVRTSTTRPATEPTAKHQARSQNAPPMPNRPKGRGFLLFLFFSMFAGAGYLAVSNFLRVESYGIVDGDLISVAAPWEGTVGRWMVREGDDVKQGQILVEINNLQTESQIDALGDQLKLAQAELEAEMSKIRFNYREHDELNQVREQKLQSELIRIQGELASEKVKLRSFEREYVRTKHLARRGSKSAESYEKMLFEFVGQRKKVSALEDEITLIKTQKQNTSSDNKDVLGNGSNQLKPILARIDMTKAEIVRLREKIELGQLTAPCDGRITQRYCLPGEPTLASVPVVEILKNNSVEAVLFVPQKHTGSYQPGDKVSLTLDPYPEPMVCVVDRLGESYEPAPKNIARFYSHQQYLLPVYLKPNSASQQWMALRLNGTIRREFDLPNGLNNAFEKSRSTMSEIAGSLKDTWQTFFAKSGVER